MSNNPWQLFESVEGWKTASAELEAALKTAVRNAHLARADGWSVAVATRRYFDEMEPMLRKYREFGANDSEGLHRLEDVIDRELGSGASRERL